MTKDDFNRAVEKVASNEPAMWVVGFAATMLGMVAFCMAAMIGFKILLITVVPFAQWLF